MWHVADGKYPQWLFFVTNDAFQRMPSAKHLMCALNSHLSSNAVADSLPKEGWSEVEFLVEWEQKEMTFQGLAMEAFARYAYLQSRQGVSEGFWTMLAPVIGGSLHNFRYLSATKNNEERRDVGQAGTPPPNRKTVQRKDHGKSPKPVTPSLVEQLEEGKQPEKELERAPAKKVCRRKELPPPEAFKFEQPLIQLPKTRYILRTRDWFRFEHPFYHMERKHDPFPAERAAKNAAKQRDEEEEKEAKKRAKPVKAGEEGSTTRVDCGLNNLYDTEAKGRVGRCTYYQDYDRKPASVVKTSWYCRQCKVGLHQECYYDYHRVVHGVILADEYEINKVRRSRKATKLHPSSTIRYQRVSVDLQDGYSCESQGSQDERVVVPPPDQVDSESAASESDAPESG